jgi:hypothetical protein
MNFFPAPLACPLLFFVSSFFPSSSLAITRAPQAPDGPAANCQKIFVGDRILNIGNIDATHLGHAQAGTVIKARQRRRNKKSKRRTRTRKKRRRNCKLICMDCDVDFVFSSRDFCEANLFSVAYFSLEQECGPTMRLLLQSQPEAFAVHERRLAQLAGRDSNNNSNSNSNSNLTNIMRSSSGASASAAAAATAAAQQQQQLQQNEFYVRALFDFDPAMAEVRSPPSLPFLSLSVSLAVCLTTMEGLEKLLTIFSLPPYMFSFLFPFSPSPSSSSFFSFFCFLPAGAGGTERASAGLQHLRHSPHQGQQRRQLVRSK